MREVPADIRRRLNLPGPDEGIDLIARTRRGEYWAIQSKFRSQRDKRLIRRELGTFTSFAFNTCNNIALAVVAHTSTKPVSKRHLLRNTVEIGLDRWQSLDHETWRLIVGRLKGRSARAVPELGNGRFIGSAVFTAERKMPRITSGAITFSGIPPRIKTQRIDRIIGTPSLMPLVADFTSMITVVPRTLEVSPAFQ